MEEQNIDVVSDISKQRRNINRGLVEMAVGTGIAIVGAVAEIKYDLGYIVNTAIPMGAGMIFMDGILRVKNGAYKLYDYAIRSSKR